MFRHRNRALFLPLLAVLTMVGAAPAYAAGDDTEAPSPPGPITVVEATTSSVELTWTPATDNVGVVEYQIVMRYEDLGYGYQSGTNSLLVEGLSASQTYAFTVSAVDAAGNRSASSPTLRVTLPPGDSQPPTVPGQPVAAEVEATNVRLIWSHSTDNIKLNRYEILRITDTGATVIGNVSQHPPGKNWFWATGLTPNTTYAFAVRAVDDAGNQSALSAPAQVTTLPAPGSAPAPHCTIRYRAVAQWPGGTSAELVIVNNTPTAVDGWTLTWDLPASQRLYSLWGAVLVGRADGNITVRNTPYRATIPAAGGTATLGYAVSGSSTPTRYSLNGKPCQAG